MLRCIDPFITSETLIELFEHYNDNSLKDNKIIVDLVWDKYNKVISSIITDIIFRIRKVAKMNKICLYDEVKANAKLMINRVSLASFHRNEINSMVNAKATYKKESETITYCEIDKHIENSNGVFSCILFDPDKYKYKIDDDYMDEAYECLEKDELDKGKFSREKSNFQNKESKKPPKKFTLETMKIDFEKNFDDKQNEFTKASKKNWTDLYFEEVKESTKMSNELWIEKIKDESVKAFDWKIEKNWIEKFPWGIKNWMEEVYNEVLKNDSEWRLIKWDEFEAPSNQYLDRNLQIVCERLYGSFPLELARMIFDKEKPKVACIRLLERAKTIVYSVKHSLFRNWEIVEYKEKNLNFLIKLFQREEITDNGELLVVAQKGEMYPEKIVLEFPFEAVIRVNSTFGRLKVLHHTDELSSLPDFSNLQSMSKILGVNNRSGITYKGN